MQCGSECHCDWCPVLIAPNLLRMFLGLSPQMLDVVSLLCCEHFWSSALSSEGDEWNHCQIQKIHSDIGFEMSVGLFQCCSVCMGAQMLHSSCAFCMETFAFAVHWQCTLMKVQSTIWTVLSQWVRSHLASQIKVLSTNITGISPSLNHFSLKSQAYSNSAAPRILTKTASQCRLARIRNLFLVRCTFLKEASFCKVNGGFAFFRSLSVPQEILPSAFSV